MSREPLRVLVVERDPADVELWVAELERAGFAVTADVVATREELGVQVAKAGYGVVLADYRLPGWTGMDALALLRERGLTTPLILVTVPLGEERAVECVRQGAADYLLKDQLAQLPPAVRRALAETRAQEERTRSAELIHKLRLAVDQSPASVLITDTKGTIEYVNQRFTEVTGYSAAEAIGKNPRLLQSGRTPIEYYRSMWQRLREGRIWQGEIQNRRRSGELYWDSVTISPIRSAEGRVTHFLAIQEDITERRRIESELREREERFRQLGDNISEVFYIMAANYRETLYINPAYERIWGRSCQSLYENPQSFLDAVALEDRHVLMDSITRNRAGEDAGEIEFRVIRPSGEVRWILSHAVPIRNSQGEVYRISGIALDITERKAAEAALRLSEHRLRTLFETVNLIALVLDAHGNIEYVNPFLLKLTGYALEEVQGKSWLGTFLPEDQRPALDRVFHELLESELHAHHENTILTRSGEARMIAWHNTVLRDDAGRPTGSLSVGEDITEHAKLEEQYHQAQKMEAVGRLAGGVAHDFNNLLTVIISYAEMLRDSLPPGDARHSDLEPISQAAVAAAGLTRQLLAFSRQQVIQPRPVAVEEVVKQSEKLLRRVIGEDIRLSTVLSPTASVINIDPGQLEQVIMNLAVNARDAMPRGGQLTIETQVMDLDDEYVKSHWPAKPGRFAMVAMSDTGIGMDAATQARIFEPFFTTKEAGEGTGLGLATVYGIVKQSGGFIWVYSEPMRGTTFKLYFPCVEQAASALVQPVPMEVQGGSETVLLCEDAAAVRAVSRTILERYGYLVLEAPSGQAALDLAAKRSGPIDLLVTDVVMPEMSGKQLADGFTALRPQSHVLFMSGYTDDAIVRHGVLQAGIAYLQKPFSPEGLARKVREVLDARKGPDSA
jgi:PAS domain S-box-containing protein